MEDWFDGCIIAIVGLKVGQPWGKNKLWLLQNADVFPQNPNCDLQNVGSEHGGPTQPLSTLSLHPVEFQDDAN